MSDGLTPIDERETSGPHSGVSRAPDGLLGQTIDRRYRVEALLGEGGMEDHLQQEVPELLLDLGVAPRTRAGGSPRRTAGTRPCGAVRRGARPRALCRAS